MRENRRPILILFIPLILDPRMVRSGVNPFYLECIGCNDWMRCSAHHSVNNFKWCFIDTQNSQLGQPWSAKEVVHLMGVTIIAHRCNSSFLLLMSSYWNIKGKCIFSKKQKKYSQIFSFNPLFIINDHLKTTITHQYKTHKLLHLRETFQPYNLWLTVYIPQFLRYFNDYASAISFSWTISYWYSFATQTKYVYA